MGEHSNRIISTKHFELYRTGCCPRHGWDIAILAFGFFFSLSIYLPDFVIAKQE